MTLSPLSNQTVSVVKLNTSLSPLSNQTNSMEVEQLNITLPLSCTSNEPIDSPDCPLPPPKASHVCCEPDPEKFREYAVFHSETNFFILSVTLYTAIFLFGVLGNGFIVYILSLREKTVVNHFLLSLCIADAFFLLTCCPYEALFRFTGWLPDVCCKIFPFIEMWMALASVFNLAAVSAERYMVIVHPVRCRRCLSKVSMLMSIVTVWIIAALLAIPCIHVKKYWSLAIYNKDNVFRDGFCTFKNQMKAYSVYRFLVMFGVPATVQLFCNIWSSITLWKSTVSLRRMSISSGTQSTDDAKEKSKEVVTVSSSFLERPKPKSKVVNARLQTIKMFAIVLLVFFLAWAPRLLYDIIRWYTGKHLTSYYFDFLVTFVRYLQSALNPVIYLSMLQSIRQSALECCIVQKCLKLWKPKQLNARSGLYK